MKIGAWLFLGGVALGVAGLNGVLNPRVPAWREDVLGEFEVRAVDVRGALGAWLILDARSEGEFFEDHVPGALLLNEDDWEALLPEVFDAWVPGQRVVVYCSSEACQASEQVAERLREEVGFADVMVMRGGWESWLELSE